MKRFRTMVLLGTLTAAQGALATQQTSMSINQFTPRVLPVLVQVDRHGKVTDVSSAVQLEPRYDRLLRQTLGEMITRPANDHGRAVASQFVINLGLETSPRSDGNYDARFVYVSTSPVPPGSWYWVHIDGHRLALRSRNELPFRQRGLERRMQPDWFDRPTQWEPAVQDNTQGRPVQPAAKHP